MNKTVRILGLAVLVLMIAIPAFAQPITLDGDSSDWVGLPNARALNNQDGYFPNDVGAIVNDTVDIKDTRISVNDDKFYAFIRTWAEIWPNKAKQKVQDGVYTQRSRGYYHILVDLDNDRTTGWDPSYFEAHYTTLGYYISQGAYSADQTIGAELMFETGIKCIYSHEDTVSTEEYMKGAWPYSITNWAGDYSTYDGQLDTGSESDIFEYIFQNYKDLTYNDGWVLVMDSLKAENPGEGVDTTRLYFGGHAFGTDFIEWGTSIKPLRDYYFKKDTVNYFKPGNVLAFCGHNETPKDDWGVDTAPRGEYTIPDEGAITSRITLDGDNSDWADLPGVDSPNNQDGYFPDVVGAIVNDTVDIKQTKMYVDENKLFAYIQTWAEIWPNKAKQKIQDGVYTQRSRGYYHILVDLDNDRTTGWEPSWFEAHYTTLGYYIAAGVIPEDQIIGAELMFETGIKCIYSHEDTMSTEEYMKGAWPYSITNWAGDYSTYDGELDTGSESDIFEYVFQHYKDLTYNDGWVLVLDTLKAESPGAGVDTNAVYFGGHAFGKDFIEWGTSVKPLRDYFMEKDGVDYFVDGNSMAYCGHNETPKDDWGVDTGARGETVVGDVPSAIGNADKNSNIVEKFELGNNYPNPFNPTTTISYKVPKSSDVSIVIYNSLGQKVRNLVKGTVQPGAHLVQWNGRNDAGSMMPSGIYFYVLEANNSRITKKMVLMK